MYCLWCVLAVGHMSATLCHFFNVKRRRNQRSDCLWLKIFVEVFTCSSHVFLICGFYLKFHWQDSLILYKSQCARYKRHLVSDFKNHFDAKKYLWPLSTHIIDWSSKMWVNVIGNLLFLMDRWSCWIFIRNNNRSYSKWRLPI